MSQADDHVLDRVDDYLHELLTPAQAAHVERHCAGCPDCRAALERARRRRAALQAVPPCEASGQLIRATLDRIHACERNRRARRRRLAWCVGGGLAASFLLLAGLHLYY